MSLLARSGNQNFKDAIFTLCNAANNWGSVLRRTRLDGRTMAWEPTKNISTCSIITCESCALEGEPWGTGVHISNCNLKHIHLAT